MKKLALALTFVVALSGASFVGAEPASASSHTCVNHTFQQGSYSGCVRLIKAMVNMAIGSSLNTNDPYYDGWTGVGVMIYQDSHGLAADGIVGPWTWMKLCQTTREYQRMGNTDAGVYAFYAGCPG
jgi:hypothetical protein